MSMTNQEQAELSGTPAHVCAQHNAAKVACAHLDHAWANAPAETVVRPVDHAWADAPAATKPVPGTVGTGTPPPLPGNRPELSETSTRLIAHLEELGREYGPRGVARTARLLVHSGEGYQPEPRSAVWMPVHTAEPQSAADVGITVPPPGPPGVSYHYTVDDDQRGGLRFPRATSRPCDCPPDPMGFDCSHEVAKTIAEGVGRTFDQYMGEHFPTTGQRARAICEKAADLVNGDRNADYGDARDNFTETGKLWAVVLGIEEITAEQVALCLDLLKTARLIHNTGHADSWVDKVGYSSLGGGIAANRRAD